MDKKETLKINALICSICEDVVYSRARHDMRLCSCGALAVDGGFDYMKVSGYPDKMTEMELTLEGVTKKDLYDDWNKSIDRYGLIKNANQG